MMFGREWIEESKNAIASNMSDGFRLTDEAVDFRSCVEPGFR